MDNKGVEQGIFEFNEFMNDNWLKVIWIYQENNIIKHDNYITNEKIRVFHKNKYCKYYVLDCYIEQNEICCCCDIDQLKFNKNSAGLILQYD